MKIIVGLGNPGKKYEKTRHNVGFMCVDAFRETFGFNEWKPNKKFNALVSESEFNNEKMLLVKPETFMNASGEAVQKIVNFYDIPLADLWVVYDDIDLPLGKIRIREDGAPGSHNGMKSVTSLLGSQNFPRLRIGIESRGLTSSSEEDISSFVLHAFGPEEWLVCEKTIKDSIKALELGLLEGVTKAQEQYN